MVPLLKKLLSCNYAEYKRRKRIINSSSTTFDKTKDSKMTTSREGKVNRNLLDEFWKSDPVLKLGDALDSEHLTDVTFLVGAREKAIKAHKLILSLGSKVFHAMFYGGMKEMHSDAPVKLPDIEPEAFLLMLRYMYTEKISIEALSMDTLTSTFYAARKYEIEKLEYALIATFEKLISADTAIGYYRMARFYDLKDMEERCLELIDKNSDQVLFSNAFLEIDRATLILLIERTSLAISEIKLFNALIRWATIECKRREISENPENLRISLGKALYAVRFPLMAAKDFANGPAKSGVLTDTEVANIFMELFCVEPPENQLFSPEKRIGAKSPHRVHCDCMGYYCAFCERIRLNCNTTGSWKNGQNQSPGASAVMTMTPSRSLPPTPIRYCSCRTRGYCPEKHGYVR